MRIKGIQQYLSLTPFEEIELPSLTIIVGLNGSGKTHFLQAIVAGAIATDLFYPLEANTLPVSPSRPPPLNEVLKLEAGNASPAELDQRVASNLTVRSSYSPTRGQVPLADMSSKQVEEKRIELLQPALDLFRSKVADSTGKEVAIGHEIWALGPELVASHILLQREQRSIIDEAFTFAQQLLVETHTADHKAHIDFTKSAIRSAISEISRRLRISPLAVSTTQIQALNGWGGFGAFAPNVAQVFAAYRDAHVRNDLQRVRDVRTSTALALSDKDFTELYGPPPWEIVSETLKDFGLNYRVAPPSEESTEPAAFTLQRLDTGAVVSFSTLSSGERVLLRFALSLMRYDPLRIGVTLPKLLLLDEMDASLHPEMLHRWLSAIANGLVKQHGLHCILTTHSPTTVALASEESLFELTSNSPVPKKISKQQALNRLTFGLPTLSVDYLGRRQMFVESDTDAAAYDRIVSIMKGALSLPRTLTFVSTGTRVGRTETNTGCALVRKLVSDLNRAGSTSVFGLIDWDGQNCQNGQVYVLAEGTHYALENLLLDPLLIGALLLRDNVIVGDMGATFASLDRLEQEGLQAIAGAVERKVVYPTSPELQRVQSRYQGGLRLEVSEVHRKLRGHDLEALIVAAHPQLKRYTSGGRGRLIAAVIDRVLVDFPKFCPAPIAEAMQAIASFEHGGTATP